VAGTHGPVPLRNVPLWYCSTAFSSSQRLFMQVARPELLLRTFTRASRRIRLLLVFLTAVTLTNVVFGAREALVGAANAPGVVLPVIAWVLLVFLASFALLWLWVLRE